MRKIAFLCFFIKFKLAFDKTNFMVRKEDDGLLYIDSIAFGEIIKQRRAMIVFYTDRYECATCPQIRKHLSQLRGDYTHDFPKDPNFFILDCSQYSDSCRPRLIRRLLPAIDLIINRHTIHYKGNFSFESLKNFIDNHFHKNRLQNFHIVTYLETLSHSKKQNTTILIFKGNLHSSHAGNIVSLSKLEFKDQFFMCADNEDCLDLFSDHQDQDILLIKGNRVEFHHSVKHESFDIFYYFYRDFKSPFFLPFGNEFRQKIMLERNSAIIYIVGDNHQKTEHSIEIYLKEIKHHFTKFYSSLIYAHQLNEKENELYQEFLEETGLIDYPLPVMIIVEAHPTRPGLRKYFVTRDYFEGSVILHTVETWHYGHLHPWPKSQNHFQAMLGKLRVVSNEMFKTIVFTGKNNKVVLLYHDFEKCPLSKLMFDLINQICEKEEYKDLDWYVMDINKNDPYIETAKVPAVQIFINKQWDNPVIFDPYANDPTKFETFLRKRKFWKKVVLTQTLDEDL